MKVLVTGMSSSHTKPSANTTFFNTLVKSIASFATVEWGTPSVLWTKEYLESFDIVLVGTVPPTSLGANKVYGAMHVIDIMYESPKLYLVVDHPQIWQFKASLASIERDISSFFSPFYSKRREYSLAIEQDPSDSIQRAASKLLSLPWPKTIYPGLPWKDTSSVSKFISTMGESSLISINLDSHLMLEPELASDRVDAWATDSTSSTWFKSVQGAATLPILPIKNSPREPEMDILSRIATSFGALISPQERGVGTWWSYRYIQAMNSLTPIVSEWRDTGSLSNDWYHMITNIEEASPRERYDIAEAQRSTYLDAIPDRFDSIEILKTILGN